MTDYFRPLVQSGTARPMGALSLAATQTWFTHAQHLRRGCAPRIVKADEIPSIVIDRLTAARAPIAGLDFSQPVIMGILNVTPDSFSDGGAYATEASALQSAEQMVQAGAHFLDIGGESTRPGAHEVDAVTEIARTEPIIRAISQSAGVPISIDTRKASVARSAVQAGVDIVNDVSGFTFDPALGPFCAEAGLAVCVMHTQGTPETMQNDPRYDDVLLEVYDFLEQQICMLEDLGMARGQIIVDPGLGFGKNQLHNLQVLRGISLFHGLGCAVLLGASRKGFIRDIGQAPDPNSRAPGSIAVALAAVQQGVQILRVHDVAQTRQALALWQAVTTGDGS